MKSFSVCFAFNPIFSWMQMDLPVRALFIMRIFGFVIEKYKKRGFQLKKNSNERIITLFVIAACTAINISRDFSANILLETIETIRSNH